MSDNFINFQNDFNTYLTKTSAGIGNKYNFDYTLNDLKEIAQPVDKKGRDKGKPDIKFLRAYDHALALKRNVDQIGKTPQDYYSAYQKEVEERVSVNNKITGIFIAARKPV